MFVTARVQAGFVEIMVEDDGTGIPEEERVRIFDRGARLDTGKPEVVGEVTFELTEFSEFGHVCLPCWGRKPCESMGSEGG